MDLSLHLLHRLLPTVSVYAHLTGRVAEGLTGATGIAAGI